MNEMITITRAEYNRLLEAAEDLADIEAYDRAKAEGGEGIPDEYVGRILDGESPLRVIRDWREMTQAALAEASGVNRVYIAQIEAGKKPGSVRALGALAGALRVPAETLMA